MKVQAQGRLARGLAVLSFLHRQRHATFGTLATHLAVNPASLSRLLAELGELGYVVAVDKPVGYVLGPAALMLTQPQPMPYAAWLTEVKNNALPIVQRAMNEAEQSVALFAREGDEVMCLVKQQHPDGMVMQHDGNRRALTDDHPWAWCLQGRPLPTSGYATAILDDRMKIAVPVNGLPLVLGSTIAGTRRAVLRHVAAVLMATAHELSAIIPTFSE